jgi:hypothetical protein
MSKADADTPKKRLQRAIEHAHEEKHRTAKGTLTLALLGRLSPGYFSASPDEKTKELERLRIEDEQRAREYAESIKTPAGRARAANEATTLYGEPLIDGPIGRAFEAFGLDPADPSDWRTLLLNLSHVLFPEPAPPGRKQEWTAERYFSLLCEIDDLEARSPSLSRNKCFAHIAQKEGNRSPDAIEKRVDVLKAAYKRAQNPKLNSWLDNQLDRLAFLYDPPIQPTPEWKKSVAKKYIKVFFRARRDVNSGENSK